MDFFFFPHKFTNIGFVMYTTCVRDQKRVSDILVLELQACAVMGMLGATSCSSARVTNSFMHWAICPVPWGFFSFGERGFNLFPDGHGLPWAIKVSLASLIQTEMPEKSVRRHHAHRSLCKWHPITIVIILPWRENGVKNHSTWN